MTTYIFAAVFAGAMILIAALISNMIQFEGGSNPKDSGKRKMWFWIFAVINPILFYLLGALVLAPNSEDDQMVFDEYMKVLPVAVAAGFVIYIIIGFVLAKAFKNGKVGNWF
jgi:sulfoxide reductase heme-binding subunit YedZ